MDTPQISTVSQREREKKKQKKTERGGDWKSVGGRVKVWESERESEKEGGRERERERESEKEGERDVEYGCFIFNYKRIDRCLGTFLLSSLRMLVVSLSICP
jgi:hypothetical protein